MKKRPCKAKVEKYSQLISYDTIFGIYTLSIQTLKSVYGRQNRRGGESTSLVVSPTTRRFEGTGTFNLLRIIIKKRRDNTRSIRYFAANQSPVSNRNCDELIFFFIYR